MALAATCVFEVRTTGNDSNGGGFDPGVGSPGTDYSQQDSAQQTYTDLVVDGASNVKITSAAHPFGSTSPGNFIHIDTTGGGAAWTVGWYEILSVAGAVATLDRSPAAVSSTAGTGSLGGAFASPGQVASIWVAKNIMYIKKGTYTISASASVAGGYVNYTVAGTDAAPNMMIGYNLDRSTNNSELRADRPTLSMGADATYGFRNESGGSAYVRNIIFDNNGHMNCYGMWLDNNFSVAENCDFLNAFICGFNNIFTTAYAINCYANGCTRGYKLRQYSSMCYGCVATACGTAGFDNQLGVSGGRFIYCIAYANSGWGFYITNVSTMCINCVSQGNTGANGHGFTVDDSTILFNCIATDNAQFGVKNNLGTAALGMYTFNCAFRNNTGGAVDSGVRQTGTITLTGDPFTNAAGGDFSLNNTAGAGAALRQLGYPATFPGISTNNYIDVGAAQAQAAAAGGVVVKKNIIVR